MEGAASAASWLKLDLSDRCMRDKFLDGVFWGLLYLSISCTHRVRDRVPKTHANEIGKWARKGPGTLSSPYVQRWSNQCPTFAPLVRALPLPLWELVAHSPAYSAFSDRSSCSVIRLKAAFENVSQCLSKIHLKGQDSLSTPGE